MIIGYERARDTLSIIEAFLAAGDFDADPPDVEVNWDDDNEVIRVLITGLTYTMHIGSDDDAYAFALDTELDDDALPRVVIVPFREIAEMTWDKGSWPKA